MADVKITDLTALTTPATDDLVCVVDVSDTTMSADGTDKKITKTFRSYFHSICNKGYD